MTPAQRAKFRRHLDRLRMMIELRPETMLLNSRQHILAWADELEAELDVEENPIRKSG